MPNRARRSNLQEREFGPGDLVKSFARRNNWPLRRCNLMVEGTGDVRYIECAALHYKKLHGKALLDDDFSVFACGELNQGGVWHLEDKFRSLSNVIMADPKDERGREFRVVAMFDDDFAGRESFKAVTGHKQSLWKPFQHAFLLKRQLPLLRGDAIALRIATEKANASWGGMDCEIEDLVSRRLLDSFANSTLDSLKREPIRSIDGIGHHYEWHRWAKDLLVGFVCDQAALDDLSLIVGVVKSFRGLLDLEPDGSPT